MNVRILMILPVICCFLGLSAQQEDGNVYSGWAEGYLDIHHISTGRGSCVFAILPDGTTMLIDAGQAGPDAQFGEARPNDSQPAGVWITRYIRQMMRPLGQNKLDYILLSHFHAEQMGGVDASSMYSQQGDYRLTGISAVGENIGFTKIVDRGWPSYNLPSMSRDGPALANYRSFVDWQTAHGAISERFVVGSARQFVLVNDASGYPNFEIRNIAASGQVWTGSAEDVETVLAADQLHEDASSAAVRISYGKFDYFAGGDLSHSDEGTAVDLEAAVGRSTGPVEVCLANHQGAYDAMREGFLNAVRPRALILQLWSAGQLEAHGLTRMLSESVYPGDRDIFASGLMEATQKVVGRKIQQLKSVQGHLLIRVHPEGACYDIFVLDDAAETFVVKSKHGPYQSR